MREYKFDIIGTGSPIVDVLTNIPDSFLETISGEKGGMELVDNEYLQALISTFPDKLYKAPGGAAANTILNLSKLGARTTFLGMLGEDENAEFYKDQFFIAGCDVSRFKSNPELPTAQCLSMITPDAERTMRTDLGAAATLDPDSISVDDYVGVRHLHIEGYLLFNRELISSVLKKAKEAGCTISLDLGSFEIVKIAEDIFPDLLRDYIDLAFANEEEGAAFIGEDNPEKALDALAELCDVAAVKLGKEGAWLKSGDEKIHVEALLTDTVRDTTGAGDLWASGFLYGYLRGLSLEECGRLGAIVGQEAVQHIGANLPEATCKTIKEAITNYIEGEAV